MQAPAQQKAPDTARGSRLPSLYSIHLCIFTPPVLEMGQSAISIFLVDRHRSLGRVFGRMCRL